jgi:hypothetical protein
LKLRHDQQNTVFASLLIRLAWYDEGCRRLHLMEKPTYRTHSSRRSSTPGDVFDMTRTVFLQARRPFTHLCFEDAPATFSSIINSATTASLNINPYLQQSVYVTTAYSPTAFHEGLSII